MPDTDRDGARRSVQFGVLAWRSLVAAQNCDDRTGAREMKDESEGTDSGRANRDGLASAAILIVTIALIIFVTITLL